MKQKYPYIFIVLIIALGIAIFYRLFVGSGVANYGDALFPTSKAALNNFYGNAFYTWYNKEFLGMGSIMQAGVGLNKIPYILPMIFFSFFTNNFSLIQLLWYIMIFSISGTSMYLLVRHLFKNELAAIFAGIFYALSPCVIERMGVHLVIFHAYAFIPLTLLFYSLFLKKTRIEHGLLFALSIFFILPSLHYMYYTVLIILLYTIFFFIFLREEKIKKIVLKPILLLVLTLVYLSFISLPLISGFIQSISNQSQLLSRFTVAWIYSLNGNTTVINSTRLIGFHDSVYRGRIFGSILSPLPPFGWSIVSYSFLFLLPISLIFRRFNGKNKEYFFFLLLAVIGIFLASTSTIYGPAIYMGFIKALPILSIALKLPDPNYNVFLIAFSSAVLLGLMISSLHRKILTNNTGHCSGKRRIFASILLISFLFLIFYNAYPITIFQNYRFKRITLPEEYNKFAGLMNAYQENFRISVFPPDVSVKHTWAPYLTTRMVDVSQIDHQFFDLVSMEATPSNSVKMQQFMINLLERESLNLGRLLGLLNIKFVAVTNDVTSQAPYIQADNMRLQRILENLSTQKSLEGFGKFGEISIFKLKDEYYLPRFYIPKQMILSDQSVEILPLLLNNIDLDARTAVLFKEQNESIVGDSKIFDKIPKMTFTKIDPTKYHIKVEGATSPYFLVFSEGFDRNWKVYLNQKKSNSSYPQKKVASYFDGQVSETKYENSPINIFETIFRKDILENKHSLINGYANAWYIEPSDVNNQLDYEITVEYWPQRLFYIGAIISVSAIILSLLLILIRRSKKNGLVQT